MASEIVDCPYCGKNVSHEVIEVKGIKIISCAKYPPNRQPMAIMSKDGYEYLNQKLSERGEDKK